MGESASSTRHWITSVRQEGRLKPRQVVRNLVVERKVFAIREATHARTWPSQGDRICFYAVRSGVVAEARIASKPERENNPLTTNQGEFPFVFAVDEVRDYSEPIAIDLRLRRRLEAFEGRDLAAQWGWFVRRMHTISKRDFRVLTGAPEG